jgi:hypothetical protein
MKRYSILNNLDKCFFCGKPAECIHEVYFGTANRQISIKNGFCAGLCHKEHNMSNSSVHYNRAMDLILKKEYQKEYEKTHTRQDFINLIGKNYLDD